MGDPLYARFNARGHKQFKGSELVEFEVSYPEYSKIGLPAHKAALDGNLYCLRDYFLSKHQKDEGVPSRDVNGATPLHLASRTNRIEVIKWLLRFTDLSPVTAAKHGETPAHVAAAQGNVECLKVMVSAEGRSDVKSGLATAVDNSGFTALHLAIVKFRNDCAKVLINELGSKGVGSLNESGITAAHVAASSGNVEILKLLSQKYKKLMTQQAADGTTPSYFAAQEGRLEALKFLAAKLKGDLVSPSNDGLKPIHAAAQCGHTHIVKFIVSQLGNQSVFDTTPDGATALHFAASSGQVGTARWLLNCDLGGKLITAKDKNGDTAAHDAADSGQTEALKFLLEGGADLYAINNEGNTPYSLALSGQDTEIANFVMAYASKAPQKQDAGPSQMTIYDLQGDVDVVTLEASPAQAGRGNDETDLAQLLKAPDKKEDLPSAKKGGKKKEPSPAKKKSKKEEQAALKKESKKEETPSGKKGGKKGKKEKEKKVKPSPSSGMKDVLKSFNDVPADSTPDKDQDDFDITDEDLAQFHNDPKPEEEEIVVRYTDSEKPPEPPAVDPPSQALQPSSYSTVGEIEEKEAKKKKKKDRKLQKSIQNALKPGKPAKSKKKVGDSNAQSTDDVKKAFSGPEMGFKPQFKSNPLQNIPGIAPPTPPPTPATGASIAPSEETPQSNLDDVEEEDNDDDDGNPYDSYSSPNVTAPEKLPEDQEEKQVEESENKKLLGDALEDLAGDESPPLQEKPVSSTSLGSAKEEDKPSPKLKPGIWPPPVEDTREPHPETGPPVKSTHPTVLKKWQPKEWKKEGKQPPPSRMDLNSWAKNVQHAELKPNEALKELKALKKPSPIAVREPAKSAPVKMQEKKPVEDEVSNNKFVALKPVKRDSGAAKQETTKTELAAIKLKKTTDKQSANFMQPGTEMASGASNELLQILKGRQN